MMALVDQHEQLLSVFTQNIDSLELKTTLNPDKLIQAHGNADSVHCALCQGDLSIDTFREHVEKGTIMKCERCDRPVKPRIVFFGEGLPSKFFEQRENIGDCDLLIIMGTSL